MEELLSGGNMSADVRRVGDVVRRPVGPWTPSVHRLLRHLAEQEFIGAPRVLGVDGAGREVLTFVPGTVVHPDSYEHVATDSGLERVAHLIRTYHNAVASFAMDPADVWQEDGRDPTGSAEVLCHNDLAPWNLVVNSERWVFIDWDLAAPGRRLWDLALPAYTFVPMGPGQPLRPKRYHAFCVAYGLTEAEERSLLDVIVERTERMAIVLLDHAASGHQPYLRLVQQGHADSWRAAAAHVREHVSRWSSSA
jgi:Phosphotransferase enzyme family